MRRHLTPILQRLRGDGGFSLVELSVALILSGIVVGTLVTVFFAFSQNAGDASGKAEHQAQAREAVAEMVTELRQATLADPTAGAVRRLSGDLLDFYSLPVGGGNPVRIVYERMDCVEGRCELWVRRYASTAGENGRFVFAATPYEQSMVLTGVLADQPIFAGADWVGDPKAKVRVSGCTVDELCDFPLVEITLRSRPSAVSEGARTVLEITEEVRLRNA